MSLSNCYNCGGYIVLGHDAPNRCVSCGLGVFERAPLPEIKMLADSELEVLRKEVTMLQAALKALRLIDRQRKTDAMISEKYPTQMDEGESANWSTDSRSASQWARDGGK